MPTSAPRGTSRRRLSRRDMLKLSLATGAGAFFAGCTPATPPATPTASPQDLLSRPNSIALERLIAEAQREGNLSVMTILRNWANYGEILDTVKSRYALNIKEILPTGSSQDEVDAIRKAKADPTYADAPDVVDMGLGFAETSKAEGIFAPYKVATWDTIPDNLKDPDGHWYGSYYGALSISVNADRVKNIPERWADLLKPEYKNMVALPSNPMRSSQSYNLVWASGLHETGTLEGAPEAGLEFFAQLQKAGNLVPKFGTADSMLSGATPIVLRWDFLALADRDKLAGQANIKVVLPQDGILGIPSIQAISAYAPHPFAARLWEEFLYSDDGQLLWLKGYAHPIRYNDLVKRKLVPDELEAKLPPSELYSRATFPTVAQTSLAKQVITENWLAKVGVEITAP